MLFDSFYMVIFFTIGISLIIGLIDYFHFNISKKDERNFIFFNLCLIYMINNALINTIDSIGLLLLYLAYGIIEAIVTMTYAYALVYCYRRIFKK